jgi:hypothetical protein
MANDIPAQRNLDLTAKLAAAAIGGVIGALGGKPLADALAVPETAMAQWAFAILAALITSGVTAAWLSHQRDMQAVHQTSTLRR